MEGKHDTEPPRVRCASISTFAYRLGNKGPVLVTPERSTYVRRPGVDAIQHEPRQPPEVALYRAVLNQALQELAAFQIVHRLAEDSREEVIKQYKLTVIWFRGRTVGDVSLQDCCDVLDRCPTRLVMALERNGLLPTVIDG